MRFDVFHVLPNPGRKRPWQELLDETRRRAELVDGLGYDGIWFGEHHFDAEGIDQLPNPVMMATDLAGRTSRLRLGIAAIALPLWHPVRLAEDLAMLDQFSGGRLDVAFSRGILAGEILNLNPDADRENEEKSRAIYAENLEIVKRAWTTDPFSWHGERYQIPWPGTKWPAKAYADYHDEDGHLAGLAIIPQPLQDPMPPMYAVSQHEAGFRLSAHQGLAVITSHPTGRKLAGLNDAYQEEAEKVGRPAHAGRMCVVVRDFCVADTEEEARRQMEPSVITRFEIIRRVRGLGAWLDKGEDPEDPQLKAMNGFDLMLERDYLLVGTPDSVAERMIRMHRELGIEHWILSPARAEDKDVEHSLRLMAEEVLPHVRRVTEATVTAGSR